MHKFSYLTILTSSIFVLSACSLAPDYQRPELPVPNNWQEDTKQNPTQHLSASQIKWQQFYLDPELKKYIALALENNRDLRIAALNVQALQARYQITSSDRLPSIGVNGGVTRQGIPRDLSQTGSRITTSSNNLSVGVSAYEVDLFNRVNSLSEAALQEYFASEQVQRSVQLSLISEVAKTYLTWRSHEQKLQLLNEIEQSYIKQLELVETSFDAGIVSALDVRQARTLLQSIRAQKATYYRLIDQVLNGLELLVGTSISTPPTVASELTEQILAPVPDGLESTVLMERPDIIAAEHKLKAANANIGAARAAFFPSITLTGSVGTASDELGNLFDGGTGTWQFIPQINLPIFTAGRLESNLNYAEIAKDIRIAEYEQAIQNAFREVADGLSARTHYQLEMQAQSEFVKETQDYLELAQERYQKGVDNLLSLLDAHRQHLYAQQLQVDTQLGQYISEINLYKALAGGAASI